MRNFYYVLSFNLTNPAVKKYLNEIKLTATLESMVDFKIRSKLFLSFNEAVTQVHEDFNKKLLPLYGETSEAHLIRGLTLVNPTYALSEMSEIVSQLIERFGDTAFSDWEDNCCSAIFFLTADDEQEEEFHHSDWMFKYEIFVSDDAIELSSNGDYVFAPTRNFSSTYH